MAQKNCCKLNILLETGKKKEPESWKKAAGILRNKKKGLMSHLRKIRLELQEI